MKLNTRWQTGVTLFELMITVAIIAIIAGIAVPLYHGYINTGYMAECKNEVAAIKLAEEEYYLENNKYFPTAPGTVSMLTTDTYPNPIEQASGGTYTSSYTSNAKIAAANCTYKVVTATASPLYTITATGANRLASQGTVEIYQK